MNYRTNNKWRIFSSGTQLLLAGLIIVAFSMCTSKSKPTKDTYSIKTEYPDLPSIEFSQSTIDSIAAQITAENLVFVDARVNDSGYNAFYNIRLRGSEYYLIEMMDSTTLITPKLSRGEPDNKQKYRCKKNNRPSVWESKFASLKEVKEQRLPNITEEELLEMIADMKVDSGKVIIFQTKGGVFNFGNKFVSLSNENYKLHLSGVTDKQGRKYIQYASVENTDGGSIEFGFSKHENLVAVMKKTLSTTEINDTTLHITAEYTNGT